MSILNGLNNWWNKLAEWFGSIRDPNDEMGVDAKLQEMKYLRIELSRLMKIIGAGGHRFNRDGLTDELRSTLKLDETIKTLERRKSALDAEIQKLNWTAEL